LWFENSRTDELASKVHELEKEDTFEFFPAAKEEYPELFPHDSTIKEDYYEVFPHDESQDENLKFIYKSLTILLQLNKET
jgi:hypothetical protein